MLATHRILPGVQNMPSQDIVHNKYIGLRVWAYFEHIVDPAFACMAVLTFVHANASVTPKTFVRYLPELHAVHVADPEAAYHPLGHCSLIFHHMIHMISA
jgi:hypothetical protein